MKTRKTTVDNTSEIRKPVDRNKPETSVDVNCDTAAKSKESFDKDDLFICQICEFKTSKGDAIAEHMEGHVHRRKTKSALSNDTVNPERLTEMESGPEMSAATGNEKFGTESQMAPSTSQRKGLKLMHLVDKLKLNQNNVVESETRGPNTAICQEKGPEDLSQDNKIEVEASDQSQKKNSEVVKLLESMTPNPNINYTTDIPDRRKQSPQQRTTIGKKCFECGVCGYRAKWLSELQKHKLVHTNEKPFPCPHCTHRSRWKGDLTRHIQKIHKIFVQPQRSRKSSKAKGKEAANKPPVPLAPLGKSPSTTVSSTNGNFMAFPGMFPSENTTVTITNSEKNGTLLTVASGSQKGDLPLKIDGMQAVTPQLQGCKTPLEQQLSEAPKTNNLVFNSENDSSLSRTSKTTLSANSLIGDQSGPTVKKMVYKCNECNFYTKTASRFHVHVVQHLNMRPYMCSDCGYRSNWQWDVTKHIKVKVAKLGTHHTAEVLLIHEAGEKNYEKYKPFLECIEEERQPQSNPSEKVQEDSLESNPKFSGALEDSPKIGAISESETPKRDFHEMSTAEKPVGLHQCKKCGFRSRDITTVQQHIITHLTNYFIPGQAFSAKLTKFDSSTQLYTINQDQNGELFMCSVCPYKTRNFEYMNFHIRQHYPKQEATNRCLFCPYWVKYEKNLMKHYNLHVSTPGTFLRELAFHTMLNVSENTNANVSEGDTNENEGTDEGETYSPKRRKFSCDRCPYTSKNRSQFMYHMQFHEKDSNMEHKCSKCDYSVSHLHLLQQHMKLHDNPSEGSEEKSDSSSSEESSIRNKQEKQHGTPGGVEESPPLPSTSNRMIKMYKCRHCPLVNKRRANVRTHELMHTKIKDSQYTCVLCNYRCDGQGALTSHMKIHDQKKVSYQQCSDEQLPSGQVQTVYLDEANIPRQRVKSGNGNLVQCPKCPSMFKAMSNLANHEKLHGSNFQFKCSFCDYAAKFKPHLQNHMKVHLSNAPTDDNGNIENPANTLFETLSNKISVRKTGEYIPAEQTEFPLVNQPRRRVSPPSFKCIKCPAKFSKNIRLKRHLSLHGANGKFTCKYCDYSVNNSIAHQKHGQLHLKTISCENLTASPRNQQQTDTTIKNVSTLDGKYGNVDNRTWLQQSADHVRTEMDNSDSRIFSCTHCPYIHHRKDAVQNHLKRHIQQNGAFKCPFCDYNVLYDSFLREHIKLHATPQMMPKLKANIENIEIHAVNLLTNESTMIFKHKRYKDSNDEMYYPEIQEERSEDEQEKAASGNEAKEAESKMPKNDQEPNNQQLHPKHEKMSPGEKNEDDLQQVSGEKENSKPSDPNSQKRYMEVMSNLDNIEDLYSVINEYLHSGGSVSYNQADEIKINK